MNLFNSRRADFLKKIVHGSLQSFFKNHRRFFYGHACKVNLSITLSDLKRRKISKKVPQKKKGKRDYELQKIYRN